jgi:hypothetical protein
MTMDQDDRTETRFLALFYGVLALIVTVALFVMLVGADLVSFVALIIPLFIAMGLLWMAVPHGHGTR